MQEDESFCFDYKAFVLKDGNAKGRTSAGSGDDFDFTGVAVGFLVAVNGIRDLERVTMCGTTI